MNGAGKIIEVENLSKSFGENVRAVDGVSFDVTEGEIFGFLGTMAPASESVTFSR